MLFKGRQASDSKPAPFNSDWRPLYLPDRIDQSRVLRKSFHTAMAALQFEKQRGRYAALAIAAVVIVVGIPLWWKTTQTYRAWLPYSEISELDTLQLQLSVDIEVVFSRGTLTPELQKKVPLSHVNEKEHQIDGK
ncbi:GPI transamidase component PIG-S [Anabarilius grahami]|uniref:GPI transamidase component PIG-S n=1 Tax=Anabarilius grahami TaxID=495550 RepID=A0A3N0YYS9_ANAGA|nr:GPI transamidase component PIG-S [Anabarilius grahami]